MAFFSGIFYSLSFLIKQSNGFIILGVSFLVLILIEWNKNRRVHLFKTALIFLLGVSIPISIIIIYLQQQHLLSIFFSSDGKRSSKRLAYCHYIWMDSAIVFFKFRGYVLHLLNHYEIAAI